MNELIKGLMLLYSNNFVVYYKAHSFHFNVQGPTFAQDHAVLEEIYTFLWEQHDMLGEQIRQFNKSVPISMSDVTTFAAIGEEENTIKNPANMYTILSDNVEGLIDNAQFVYDTAGDARQGGCETLIGDYLKSLSKLYWKLKALQGKSFV